MGARIAAKVSNDLDGLRLLALGRIPRCGSCPRFRSLVAIHAGSRAGDLPAVPAFCTHAVCAPLAARWDAQRRGGEARPEAEATSLRRRAS
jgi:hypothetical protein